MKCDKKSLISSQSTLHKSCQVQKKEMEKAMKDIQFSNQIKKGLQIVVMFAILFLKFGTIGASIAYAAPSNDTFSGATPILSVPNQYNVDTTTATTAGETG